MTITVIGDSLSAGFLGIPYLRYLRIPPGAKLVNRGRDADTVLGVLERLESALRVDSSELLIVEVGANDILLPEMAERGGDWKPFIEKTIADGSVPSPDLQNFTARYEKILETAGAWGINTVACLTIIPIGENLASERNRTRQTFNACIRRSAVDSGSVLVDTAHAFDTALSEFAPSLSDCLFDSPRQFRDDIARIHRDGGSQPLSRERGLHLTMDGAHLNERGAALFAETVHRALWPSSG